MEEKKVKEEVQNYENTEQEKARMLAIKMQKTSMEIRRNIR